MKNRKTAVLLGAAALTAALGLGYGLLTGAEQAEESRCSGVFAHGRRQRDLLRK